MSSSHSSEALFAPEAGQQSQQSDSLPASRGRSRSKRLWEIDALRGLAVLAMVIYHLLWDLWHLGVLPDIVLWEGFWKYFQRAIATAFILLTGASMALLTQRTPLGDEGALIRRLALRGLNILGLGLLITLAIGASGIGRLDFGILHLLGASIVLAIPFRKRSWVNLLLWPAFFVAGAAVQSIDATTLWLVPLGLAPAGYAPLDYFPLVPWFGVVLLGMGLANLLYAPSGRRFHLPDGFSIAPILWLQSLGRHSLVIYLLHQPALWAILYVLGMTQP